MPKILEQTESESPSEVHQTGPANGESKTARKEVGGGRPAVNFASGLLENSNLKQPRKSVDFLISLAGQTAFVILLILLPLCYTQAFNPPEFERMMLIMPPPPPPPPAPLVREIVKPKASLFQNGKLFAPRTVPKHIEIVKEAPEETPGPAGVAGGVPGGVPGGTLGGVLGGILSPGNQPVPPPPPPRPVKSNRPLLVGGRVQAPRLIQKIQPVYPPLARETKTHGAVVLDCVIDKQGNVIQIKLVSGNPLLVQAAFAAVRQWKYQPTLLDGVPFAVEMRVTVTFTMGS